MTKSHFNFDLKLEEAFAKFLDENFYCQDNVFRDCEFERVTDIKKQQKGIDLIANCNGNEHLVDEKSQFSYVNKNALPTFAFEIKNFNSGNVGWLLNPQLDTTHYILYRKIMTQCNTPLNYEDENNKNQILTDFKNGNITSFTCDIVAKESVLAFLASIGLDQNELNKLTKQSSDNLTVDPKNENKFTVNVINETFQNAVYVIDTPWLKEKPRNLIINFQTIGWMKNELQNNKFRHVEDILNNFDFLEESYPSQINNLQKG